ncbi:MAG: hypothetical protein KGH59_00380 [Candidatus Micrarchaeota archaeon]|nr:hypothetical protein [Candidatus Micrarchaeota archaeon]MDE1804230.1 hypothetical protein [Candidatus Micrarchaeota archaeon]MDE1846686.1 hypothetical protein [Candidatus Micrarchaeota archaeon]
MAKGSNAGKKLLREYTIIGKMTNQIVLHQKGIKQIRKKVAKRRSDVGYGIIENLDIALLHMNRAKQELDKAMKELKSV